MKAHSKLISLRLIKITLLAALWLCQASSVCCLSAAMPPCISWTNPSIPPKVALLCIHGLGLYSGSYSDFGKHMASHGVSTYAIDVRGFGSWMKANGHAKVDFDGCLVDIETAIKSIRAANPGLPVYLLGESMGGAIALRFAALHPDLVDGLISSVPAGDRFQQKRTDIEVALKLLKGPNKEFDIGDQIVKQATTSEKLRTAWETNPLDRMDLSAKELIHFQSFMNENHEFAQKITNLPVLFVQGNKDKLVKPEGTWELFNKLNTERKMFIALPSEHLIFEETQMDDKDMVADRAHIVTAWIFSQSPSISHLMTAPQDTNQLSQAVTMMVAGQYSEATKILEQLTDCEPSNADLHYWLGLACAKNDAPEPARQHLVKAISLGKGSSAAKQANNHLLKMSTTQIKPVGNQQNIATTDTKLSPDSQTVTKADSTPAISSAQLPGDDKPSVFIFYATWCEQCDKLDKLIAEAASVFGDQVKFTKVDVDKEENQNLINQFAVGPIPTFVYLDKGGKVASTIIGQTNFLNFASNLKPLVPQDPN
jgi:alpha-beta hydrolase superfamily lysophospholipase/thiol-disulfide isomerase/thioredoxin